LTLLFDLTIDESTSRTRRRSNGKQKGDRLDAENIEFHTRVRDAYLQLARAEPNRVKVIETNRPVEETHQRVKEIVIPFLKSRGHVCGDVANSFATVPAKTAK
jgi:dTMP kinase